MIKAPEALNMTEAARTKRRLDLARHSEELEIIIKENAGVGSSSIEISEGYDHLFEYVELYTSDLVNLGYRVLPTMDESKDKKFIISWDPREILDHRL